MKDIARARYTLEFKQEAVCLVEGGETPSAVARTLGVSFQSVDNWLKPASAAPTIGSGSCSAASAPVQRYTARSRTAPSRAKFHPAPMVLDGARRRSTAGLPTRLPIAPMIAQLFSGD